MFYSFMLFLLITIPNLLVTMIFMRIVLQFLGSNFKQDCLRLLKLMGVPCIQVFNFFNFVSFLT